MPKQRRSTRTATDADLILETTDNATLLDMLDRVKRARIDPVAEWVVNEPA